MPELQVEPGNWVGLMIKAYGLMIDPSDPNLDVKLGAAFDPLFRASMDKAFPEALPPPTREEYAKAAAADPAGLRVDRKLDDYMAGILIGGRILENGLRLAEHAPRLFSLKNATELVERELMEAGLQSNRTFVSGCWRRVKPASHILCAHIRNPERLMRANGMVSTLPSISQPTKQQTAFGLSEPGLTGFLGSMATMGQSFGVKLRAEVEAMLAEAEALRMLGEKRFAHGQKAKGKPFLDPKQMWTIPEGFNLPSVHLEFEPLTKVETAILHGVN